MLYPQYLSTVILICASLCNGLQMLLPSTTQLDADTNVHLIHEAGDPGSFFLKTVQVQEQNVGTPVHDFNSNATTVLNFATSRQYVVQAISFSNPKHPLILNVSNIIQVLPESCNKENPTGIIVGSVFGIVFILICAGFNLYIYVRHRRRQASSTESSMSSLRRYLTSRYYGNPPPPVTPPRPSTLSADPYAHFKGVPRTHASLDSRTIHGLRDSSMLPLTPLDVARPFTDRQMQIRQRIYELQSTLLKLELKAGGGLGTSELRLDVVNHEVDVLQTKTKIEALNDYLQSPWAMHLSDVMPPELEACF